MKKTVFSLLLGICVLLAGCNDNPDSDEMTLQQRLAYAKDGDEIDITAEKLTSIANVSLSVDKAVTIKNGSAAGSSFVIKASGVVFDGVTGIQSITVAEGAKGFSVKNGDELTYLTITGGSNSESKICIASTVIDEATVGRADAHIVLGETDAAEIPEPVAAVRSVGSRASSRTSASIKKITITEKCILESASESDTFTRISVASGVENVTLRGKANIEQLVVTSSESKILVGSSDVKIEQGGTMDGKDLTIKSEEGAESVVIPETKPLDINPAWRVWTDSEYVKEGGKAVINSFDENSITVSASKTPSRYPWDATVYFLHTLEKEAQYLVEFEAKFTGTPAETSFNVYDVTQKKNICVAPFSPTSEWRTYRFMAPIHSAGCQEAFPGYTGDEIEFSFRLTEGTLEVKNFTVYNCWAEDFQYGSELKKWDVWFSAGCGASVMMYDVSETAAKAMRSVSYSEEINGYPDVSAFLTNVGYILGDLEEGSYCFSFYSGNSNLLKLNIHDASGNNSEDFAQASGFTDSGNYYVVFDVPSERSGHSVVMQFWINRPLDKKDKWQYVLTDTLDISQIKFGHESEINVPDGSIKLQCTTDIKYD